MDLLSNNFESLWEIIINCSIFGNERAPQVGVHNANILNYMLHITKFIEDNIIEFNEYYKDILKSDSPFIQEAVGHITKMKGKQIRPILVMLSCGMYSVIDKKTYTAASIIELTHMASLIHDDIVDEAYTRRHVWSVNALWRSRNAVLIGDYVFAKAIHIASTNKMYNIIDDISCAIENMSVGELQQANATLRLNISESEYFEVIRNKTAILMGSCLFNGSLIGGADEKTAQEMRIIGEKIGYIFQIIDDILDYSTNDTGKQSCNDIKERKITLPLIYALASGTKEERNNIISIIRDVNKVKDGVSSIYNYVIEKGGIEKAMEKVEQIKEDITHSLECYPQNEYSKALVALTEYICKRKA
ncbi:MAG: polyprenyl synthetase family protein [Rikenellaceae bacterium]